MPREISPSSHLVLFVGAAVSIGGACILLVADFLNKKKLQKKLQEKKLNVRASFDLIRESLDKVPLTVDGKKAIISMSFNTLQAKLKSGELTSLDVLHAYQSKALEVTSEINCLAEYITEAEKTAGACDRLMDKHLSLHGIPISLKENIGIRGYDSTGGLIINVGKPSILDSAIVQVFVKHGAIPFVKTNISQSMYSYSCSNPIYGITKNPHNPTRTSGGSSGGEGALVGAKGSIIGLGGDVGGSVRIPANFCGVCALKPTMGRFRKKVAFLVLLESPGSLIINRYDHGRCEKYLPQCVSVRNTQHSVDVCWQVHGVVGPIARDVDSLIAATRVLASSDMFQLDPYLPKLYFNEELLKSKQPLKIGYFSWDGNLYPLPVVVRAVEEAMHALQSIGHTLLQFSPPDYGEVYAELYVGTMVGGDQGLVLREKLKGDILDEGIKMVRYLSLPRWLLISLGTIISLWDPMLGKILKSMKSDGSTFSWFQHVEKVQAYRERFLRQFQNQGLDALLCPVFPSPAPLLGDIGKLTGAGSVSALFNLVNFTAGTIPVTRVTKQDIVAANNPRLYKAKSTSEKLLKRSCSTADSEGLPVGVQLATLPYTEELCLRLMHELETALKSGTK